MSLGLAIIFIGICVALLVSNVLGVILVLLGVFLLLAPYVR